MRKNIDIMKSPTPEQVAMLHQAMDIPVLADDEYSEFSETELRQFKRAKNWQAKTNSYASVIKKAAA